MSIAAILGIVFVIILALVLIFLAQFGEGGPWDEIEDFTDQ